MSNAPALLGDIPLPTLLRDNPDHGFESWVIESYFEAEGEKEAETLRSLSAKAANIRLIFCRALHALGPGGPTSEQLCTARTNNAGCLHGEQWTSGLGIIRQFVQAALGLRLATVEEVQTIKDAQDVLGYCDVYTHANAPDVREGKITLETMEDVVRRKQEDKGNAALAIRDVVLRRVRQNLDLAWEAF